MQIKDLKKLVLTSKKESLEKSRAYAAILKQVENVTIGVKKVDKTEEELILNAAKKELKEQTQSKELNAPYSVETMDICEEIISKLSPKLMSERETEVAIQSILLETNKKGEIMKILKTEYSNIDMKLANTIIDRLL